MASMEDRDAKIALAKEKLKKFQKKKTTHGETNSLTGDSVNGSVGDVSLRSSPGLDTRQMVPLHENVAVGLEEVKAQLLNGARDGFWEGARSSEAFSPTNGIVTYVATEHSFDNQHSATNGHAAADQEEIQRLKTTVENLMNRNQLLNKEIEMERSSMESKIIGEHQSLREQLSSHIQAIGILVAEKTELQAALTQADFIAKKKAAEAENYSSKLADLHEKMTAHERSLNRSSLDGEVHEARSVEQTNEISRLKEANNSLENNLDQLRDEVFECKRKLSLKDVEVKALQDRNSDLQNQLETAARFSESSRKSSSATDLQSEQASQDKRKLEARVHEYQNEITRLQMDMEQMVSRYQVLLTQANQARDAKLIDPALVSRISELEQANEQLRSDTVNFKTEHDLTQQSLQSKAGVTAELETRILQLQTAISEQANLIEELREKSAEDQQEVLQLRASYDQLTAQFSDQTNLLTVMESDKVALSRAMTQNKDLKDRLAVLMAELDQSRQDRLLRDQRILVLESDLENHHHVSQEAIQHHSPPEPHHNQPIKQSAEVQTEYSPETALPAVSPAYLRAFEVKVRNLEDEVTMYKNRQLQADSEVIYLKNALRIREEEAKLLDLTERVGAYRHLEHRFVGAMKQNAELTDRVDQLEHVIMQLQGETETIGDYIALYQSQRSLQRQREMEKVAQIDFLNQEREDLKEKLKQLQAVVRNHLQSTDHARSHHLDVQQTGDVPDSSAVNGETLQETVRVQDAAAATSDAETRVILQLLDDIDTHIKLEPLPTSLSSFSSSNLNSLLVPDSMLECSCCTGDLKIV